MGKLLVVLLAMAVVAELIAVLVIAGALFWFGAVETTAVGAGMLVVALLAGVVAVRAMRLGR